MKMENKDYRDLQEQQSDANIPVGVPITDQHFNTMPQPAQINPYFNNNAYQNNMGNQPVISQGPHGINLQ